MVVGLCSGRSQKQKQENVEIFSKSAWHSSEFCSVQWELIHAVKVILLSLVTGLGCDGHGPGGYGYGRGVDGYGRGGDGHGQRGGKGKPNPTWNTRYLE